jgi:hypothetical protein
MESVKMNPTQKRRGANTFMTTTIPTKKGNALSQPTGIHAFI